MKNKGLIILLCISALVFPASGATVTIGDYTVVPGGSVVAQMMVNNVTNLGSVTVKLGFDPAVVHVTSVSAGTGNAMTWALTSNVDNPAGFAIVTTGDQNGLSGNVIIANFILNAVGSGGTSSPLNIEINSFADATLSNDIPVTPVNGIFTITASGAQPGKPGGVGGQGVGGGLSGEKTSNSEVTITTKSQGTAQPTVTPISTPSDTPAPGVAGTSTPKLLAAIPAWLIAVVIGAASYFFVLMKK